MDAKPSDSESSPEVLAARARAKAYLQAAMAAKDPVDGASLALAQSFAKESDRGVILASAAYIDDELEQLLRSSFLSDNHAVKKAVDPLLEEGSGPLGSFSARCKMAYALGLIDQATFTAVNILRGLRNTCAHHAHAIELTESLVNNFVLALPLWQQLLIRAAAALNEGKLDEIEATWSKLKTVLEKLLSPPLIPQIPITRDLATVRVKFTWAVALIVDEIKTTSRTKK